MGVRGGGGNCDRVRRQGPCSRTSQGCCQVACCQRLVSCLPVGLQRRIVHNCCAYAEEFAASLRSLISRLRSAPKPTVKAAPPPVIAHKQDSDEDEDEFESSDE